MFASARSCPGATAWLLGSALAAALLTCIQTQLVSEELNFSHVLATCLSQGKASLVASRSWQYLTGVNLTRSGRVMCQLNVSIVARFDPPAAHLNQTSLVTPETRLLFRIDRLHLEERTRDASWCSNTSFVALKHVAARSDTLCSNLADRFAWLENWLTVTIFSHSERSIVRLDASFAALLAINVCEGGRPGTATLEVDSMTYVYAPGDWYKALLQQDSECEADRNYTVLARASDTSRLLRVTVLAAPASGDGGCRRLCVESRCLVAADANASFELAEHVKIVYAAVKRCFGDEQTGFTLQLESLAPNLRSSSADGRIALVASLISVAMVVVIIVVTVIAIRKRRLRDGERGFQLSEPSSQAVVSSRSNEYTSLPQSCPDGSDVATASIASIEKEIAMVDNDLYA